VAAYHKENATEYLVTTRLSGIDASETDLHSDKAAVIRLFAESLRTLHALEAEDCPQNWTPESSIERGRRRVADGPVFTHGDYCMPNILIHDSRLSGNVDLGYAGLGDPYRDFVSTYYTVRRNLGEEWITPFFEAYGVQIDPQKMEWYRWLHAFG
jgi:kanamycin kinase/aminoglycoside 3'-phosphotransferase-2